MISPTDLLHPSPAPHFKTFQVFLIYCPKRPSFSTVGMRLNILLSVAEIRKCLRNLHESKTEDGCPLGVYTTMYENMQS